jgi:hypothetical protein
VAAAGGGQGTGRVRGHELDVDPLVVGGRSCPEPLAGVENPADGVRVPGVGEEEVEEARTGDLDTVEGGAEAARELVAQPRRDVARRRPDDRRQHERRVRRVVAVAGLLRALQRGPRARGVAVGHRAGSRLDGGAKVGDGRQGRR